MATDLDNHPVARQAIVLVLGLLVSVLVGFIPDWSGVPFSTAEQTVLTIGLFVAFVCVDVLWVVTELSRHSKREIDLWTVQRPGETALANARAHFARVATEAVGPNDLFVTHFTKDFEKLSRRLADAADKKELYVQSDYYLNDVEVFQAFLGNDDQPILRYTWPVRKGDRLFAEHAWRRFFEVVDEMARSGKLASVRVVLVLDDLQTAKEPIIVKLLNFFKTSERQECRFIERATYESIATETQIPVNFLDFGIYGDRMLFRSMQYGPEYAGVFSKDVALIRTYVKFFDTLWESVGVMKRNPSVGATVVTLEEIIATDMA